MSMNSNAQTAETGEIVSDASLEFQRLKLFNAIHFYKPYEKQAEFHSKGLSFDQRCMGAGNQLGKTLCGAMEAAYHAIGIYPPDWDGQRFSFPTIGWVCGVTGEVIRDTTQKLLIGRIQDPNGLGTGSIPQTRIIEPVRSHGIRDLLDHVKVKHVSGGYSLIFFKSYANGREKFQGETIDWIWFDEEPPPDIYAEGLTRTNNGQKGQFAWLTFTPLKGMTEVVRQFYEDPSQHQTLTMMTIHDVDHYTAEEKASIILSYPVHERDARAKGIPTLGSGRVFPVSEELITIEPIEIPNWWPRIKGLDFGWDHPTALICLAWDNENDVIYVYDAHKERQVSASVFASAINHRENWIPVSWPHDGLQHDKGSGTQLAQQYINEGVNMLDERATWDDGSNGVEAGNFEMLDRMRTGRLKVFSNLGVWFDEFRLYHRIDGKLNKIKDDLLSATRYAIMMLRFAETVPSVWEEEEVYEETGVMGY